MLITRMWRTIAVLALPFVVVQGAHGWGRDGHMLIGRLAAKYLPSDVPSFLRNGQAQDTLEYLGPEPDRWKNRAEDELSQEQSPDHFIDLEWAELVGPLPKRRYDFVRALSVAQGKYPSLQLTPEKVGMQPWQVEEVYQRLKAAMREYRTLVATNKDTRPDEMAILFYAGWLGHYVGDGSQPLHVTIQYNGWTGGNPKGFTTEHSIHSQFESVYVSANVKPAGVDTLVASAAPKLLSNEWVDYLAYLHHTGTLVEKTYELEKVGGFSGTGTADGKAFAEERLAAGAIELRDMIYTAWVRSGEPVQEYKGPA